MRNQKISVKPQGDALRIRACKDRMPEHDMMLEMEPAEEMALKVLEEVAAWRMRKAAGDE